MRVLTCQLVCFWFFCGYWSVQIYGIDYDTRHVIWYFIRNEFVEKGHVNVMADTMDLTRCVC